MSRKIFHVAASCAAIALLFGATSAAHAALIITPAGTNSTSLSLSGPGSDRAGTHGLLVGGVDATPLSLGAAVVANSRYISNVAADRPVAFSGGAAVATANTNYTLEFTIDPGTTSSKVTYVIDIDTLIRGSLTVIDDQLSLGSGGESTISNVTAKVNGVNNAPLSLGVAGSRGGTSSTSGNEDQVFGQNGISLGPFSGPTTFQLNFTWTTTARSPQNAAGGDEHAVRLGAAGPLSGADADNYPGVGSRNINLDGHFVTVTATVVSIPEPSTLAMALIAGLGIGLFGWRRRRV